MSATAKARTPQGPPQVHEPPPPRGGRLVVAVVLALLVTLTVGMFVYADPDIVLATADDRFLHSADGGRTWQSRDVATALSLLDWSGTRGLYGINP